MRPMMRNLMTATLLAGCSLAMAACSTPTSPAVEQARAAVAGARANPEVVSRAQPELNAAQEALAQSERALTEEDDLEQAEALAYVAERQAQAAEHLAVARAETEAVQGAGEARERAIRQTLEQRLAELQAERTDRGLVVGLAGDVLFAVDQATLSPGGLREVDRVASALRDFPQATAIIEGHTDSTGSDDHNLSLSERRADAVRAELVAAGIDPARLVARGLGETYPKAPNDTAAGRQQNRRVEVVIQEGGA
ncbi:OmpA family protein [Geminicoccus sp.]|uniref:OmpA family protein n=1 Tax=Geminicoccus sp. TaxID=2024832 RepID=UPI002D7EB468|nr:OmpA family protein [Geminicoccus sp.]